MSLNETIDDLEDGEIDESTAFVSPFSPNSVTNEKKNSTDISPIFQTLLSKEKNPLFGSIDTDLRVRQHTNVFNDCDERFLANKSTFGPNVSFNQRFRQKIANQRYPNPLPLYSRPRIGTFLRPSNDNRFQSFDGRPRLSLRVPENQIPVRMRSQMRPLLPTPVFPVRYRSPLQSEAQTYPPNETESDLMINPQTRPLIPLSAATVQSVPFVSNEWQTSNAEQIFIPVSNRLNPIIPFICEPNENQRDVNISQNEDIVEISSQKTIETIVLSSNEDIEEVQMQVSDADEPYDPEQDITLMCPTLSPPLSPERIEDRGNIFRAVPIISSDSLVETNNENLNKNERKSSNQTRNETFDKNQRLKRLLKVKEKNEMSSNKRKRHNKGKVPMKETIRMTPKIVSKFENTMKPVHFSINKKVHNKSCCKHKSRRKVKKIDKQKVQTISVKDSSYEDLLEEYERIKRQLQELESEDNEKIVEKESDRQEKERIEDLFKSDDIQEVNDLVVSEDDDENELRRLALESKRKRELKMAEEKEADEEEELLRQQLLDSLKSKSKLMSQSNKENDISNESQENISLKLLESDSKIESIHESADKNQIFLVNKSETESNKKDETIPLKPVPKLIIHFGDDSTDDELEMRNVSNLSGPIGLDSFIRQERLRSENHSTPPIPSVLSSTQLKQLEELKAEIARRESKLNIQISDKKLKENEIHWKLAKERLNEKMSKRSLLKNRVNLKRNALRRAQIQARKMQEAFRAATRLVSSTASELHSFNNELTNIEKDVKQEIQSIDKLEKECIRMGLKLKGNSYKLPLPLIIKRSNSASLPISPNRKRLKSENMSKEEITDEKKKLVKKLENCHKLLNLKKANLIRPNSPNLMIKSTQNSNLNNDRTIDSQQVLKSLVKDLLTISSSDSVISYNCFLEEMFSHKNAKPLNISISISENDSNSDVIYKNKVLEDSYDSVLLHLHSYRLIENQSIPISSNLWANNINPLQEICKFDLLGTCKDDKCLGQHFDKLLLDPYYKIVDLLLYEPKIGGINSEIPEKMDLELFDAIKQKLYTFSQKLIDSNPKIPLETHCRKIAEQIRMRTNESVVCLLSRRIPKIFDTLKVEVPFDDLMYRFSIKDKSLVINRTMISELKLSADPDINFKSRFYAPEGVPISAQLETSLSTDPHNIQLWIKLAYYHISRGNNNNFADSVDRALNVLSRALDNNRSEPELYEHYLFVYSNRIIRKDEDSRLDLFNICRKVLDNCPHYRVRKSVLSLFIDINDKLKVSLEVINDLLKKSVSLNDNFETRSHQILEIFYYKIRLNLEQNDIKQSIIEFNRAFNKSYFDKSKEDNEMPYIFDVLTISDRVFGWLSFTYILIHNSLPNHCFELSKQGFPKLIDKKPFTFNWISLKNKINLNEMKDHLMKAIEYCDIKDLSGLNANHLAIHLNYAELCFVNENNQNYYQYLMEFTQNNPMIWPSIVRHRFKSNENSNLIEILKNSSLYGNNVKTIRLNIAKHYYKSLQIPETRNELLSIASDYYNCFISEINLIEAFEALLLEDEENNHNFELINNRKSKESDSPIIWLSYILLLEIDGYSVTEIDSTFQTALALCSVDKTNTKDLQFLWSNYLEFCVQNMKNEKQLMDLFESVRHCCLTITDPTFQSQVIRFFCRLITTNEKFKALIQFAKLIPQNIDIILTAINFGLRFNKKESLWIFINTIVFDRKIRLKCLQFWKIAIGLAIERSDHLSVHKFFQIAISLMPYNKTLWQNFKIYETGVKHSEHLKQGKDFCENQLKIFLF